MPDSLQPRKNILVLHRMPESTARYAETIDHNAHDVTYVVPPGRLSTVPQGVPALVIERPDTGDIAADVLAAIVDLPKPDVLVALHEIELIAAAQVREALNIPGPREADIIPVRDKVVMKRAVAAAGLRAPYFAPLQAALDGQPDHLPWKGRTVLKPVAGGATEGVSMHPSPGEALAAARNSAETVDVADYEIEEYIEGPIFQIDGVMADGELVAVQASRYRGTFFAFAQGLPLGSIQVETPPETAAWTRDCVRAVGIMDGPFHLEAIESAEGLVFLEVGARVGGSWTTDLFEFATGVHLPSAHIRLLVEGSIGTLSPRTAPADQRYAAFMLGGHTLGSRYCRISGEAPFRTDPLVRQWLQLTEDQPLHDGQTYTESELPIFGVIGPGTTEDLERFVDDLFASVRVEPLN